MFDSDDRIIQYFEKNPHMIFWFHLFSIVVAVIGIAFKFAMWRIELDLLNEQFEAHQREARERDQRGVGQQRAQHRRGNRRHAG